MFGLFGNKTRPIGLDIGYDAIRMIQLGTQNGVSKVLAAEKSIIDPDIRNDSRQRNDFIVRAIKEMIARGSFSGRNVISCLPNDKIKIKSLRLDTTDPEEIDNMLRKEFAQRFGLDINTDEIRYIIAGNVHQGDEIKNEIIFFGKEKSNVVNHIEMIESAGLIPHAIDAVPFALFRSFQTSLRRQEDQQLVSVFVDVGSLYTTVIIARGQQIIFVKQIPLARKHFNEEIASKLSITVEEAVILRTKLRSPDEGGIDGSTKQAVIDAMSQIIEKLAREVSLCFRYYAVTFRGERPTDAIFSGAEAYEDTLLNALNRHLGVEVKIAQPLRSFDLGNANLPSDEKAELSQWAVAVGLSIKGWELVPCGR